jgi:cobalt-precorrin 5A hydrolase
VFDAKNSPIAVWALTEDGAQLGQRLLAHLPAGQLHLARAIKRQAVGAVVFDRLREAVAENFHRFAAHIFFCATGIAVRTVAELIRHKSVDPAVVVVDDAGRFAISLLAGHQGGANALARQIASWIGAEPVITTATDVRGVPAIDLIAQTRGLHIENQKAIRHVSAALLRGESVWVHDPWHCLEGALGPEWVQPFPEPDDATAWEAFGEQAGIFVGDNRIDLPPRILVLRPPSLFLGVGCNRGTPAAEILALIERVCAQHSLAPASIAGLASVSLKRDEAGLHEAAAALGVVAVFYERAVLEAVANVPNPSAMVVKHIGIPSVCEAAAILAADNGNLVVPKRTTRNVTLAVARRDFASSA